MSWVTVGVMGGTALLNSMKEQQARKQQEAQNLAAAEQTRMSPWTRMGAGQLDTSVHSPLSGALQGAIGGAGLASSLNKAGVFGKAQVPGQSVPYDPNNPFSGNGQGQGPLLAYQNK